MSLAAAWAMTSMSLFEHPSFADHEHVSFFSDPASGLRAITAIHSTAPMGVAGGGCRMVDYPSSAEALTDALRLSKAMSYKLALAGLPSGGAKTVVIADPKRDKTEALLRALGRCVDRLGGRYIIAEDVGTTPEDMQIIGDETQYVVGRKADTSPATGYGVFVGLRHAAQTLLERDLEGLHVAIQGVGGVGRHLARHLHEAGARLTVADPDEDATTDAARRFHADVVSPDAIFDVSADVFAPCALGGVLDARTVERLRVRMVAGGANNQLAGPGVAQALADRDIAFIPDFVLNMGGVLGAAQEGLQLGGDDDHDIDEAKAFASCKRVAEVLDDVLAVSRREDRLPHEAAELLARRAMADMAA